VTKWFVGLQPGTERVDNKKATQNQSSCLAGISVGIQREAEAA